MASNGSYAATLSPVPTTTSSSGDTFASHLLSSSISSLSAGGARTSSHISKTYRQASTLFLTRRLPEALTTILPLVTPIPDPASSVVEPAPVARASRTTRIKVWSLYLTTLNAIVELDPNEGKDAFGSQEWRALCSKVREGEIWEEVVHNGYHGVEGDVDSEVVINLATLLLAHARTQTLNQKRLESYLEACSAPNMDISGRFAKSQSPAPHASRRYRSPAKASGANTPRDLNARVKILELYTLHVLIRNNEWDYAREFISVSSVLDDERREAFLQALQTLQEEQIEADRIETEEKQRQEEQLRNEIAEAKRLRAENEERERRRLEEERVRREASEVDYGVEQTPSLPGPTQGRHARTNSTASGNSGRHSNGPSRPVAPRPRAKPAAAPTLTARANVLLHHIRSAIEQLATSLRSNPTLLLRLVVFIVGFIMVFGQRGLRERVQRLLRSGWAKVRATAGMGVKVSYV